MRGRNEQTRSIERGSSYGLDDLYRLLRSWRFSSLFDDGWIGGEIMGYKQFRKRLPDEKMSREVKVYIPKSLYDSLRTKSEQTKLPMSRLVAFAIDKELDQGDKAFSYDVEMPKTVYIEGAYIEEGGKIYRYLVKNGTPLSIDQLVLARREIGILNKTTLLLGIRELIKRTTLVELIAPLNYKFRFADNYRLIAVKTTEEEKNKKNIAKLEEALAKLKGQKDGGPFGTKTPDDQDTEK